MYSNTREICLFAIVSVFLVTFACGCAPQVTVIAHSEDLEKVMTSDFAIDPADSAVLYAATTTGVFKSSDQGKGWAVVGLANITINTLATASTIPTTIYAGTDQGLFRSTDGGENWNAMRIDPAVPYINVLEIDPRNPSTLYIGTGGDEVLRSTDNGESWSLIDNGLAGTYVRNLVIDPQNPDTLYAGTYGDGAYKSTDAGASWKAINRGLRARNIRAMAIDPLTPTTVYASGDGEVFKSVDGGANWDTLASIGAVALVVDPANPDVLYAGHTGGRVSRSTNGGREWEGMYFIPEDSIADPILIDPTSSSTLYVGTVFYGVYVVSVP